MNFRNAPQGRLRHFSAVLVITVVFFAGFALGSGRMIGAAQSDFTPPPDAESAFESFWQVYNLIESDYIEDVDAAALVDGATRGLVDSLGDQYSGYMNPEEYDLLNSDLSGEFEGIGVVIRTLEDTGEVEVVGLLEGAPAQAAGILPGDIFATVNGIEVATMNQTQLAAHVRGKEGTQVSITMRRDDELIDFTITRAHITVPNTETDVLEGDIGYVKLNQFTANAREELDAALQDVDAANRSGLILDLRNNPGGLLSSAIDIASAFVEDGAVVIEDFGDDNERIYEATGDYAGVDVPMVVLVNEGSASASELLAGALQDHDIATVIGVTTVGKGTVQTWHELINGGGVRLTIARWLTPERRWIHDQGITPDIAVEWERETYTEDEPDPQLEAAVDFLAAVGVETAQQP